MRRHHAGCSVTGCTHRAWLHIHHCDLRSEGGTHDPKRLVPLCDTHHRHHHDGRLLIDGSWSRGFVFRHADGTPYGAPRLAAGRADVLHVVFSALSKSGFRESEARQAIDAIRSRVGPDTTVEQAARMGFIAARELPRRSRVHSVREALAPYLRSPRGNRRSGRDDPGRRPPASVPRVQALHRAAEQLPAITPGASGPLATAARAATPGA